MTDQNPSQGQPDFQPPGGDPAGQPVPPVQPPAQPFPPPDQSFPPAQPYPPQAQPFPPPAQAFPPPAQAFPPQGQPYQTPPQRPAGGRGSIWLGIGITVAVLLASWGLTTAVPYDSQLASVTNLLAGILPFALLLGGVVMAAIPRTTRTGAGILIAIGAGILIAGGLCFALVLGLDAFGG
jgi:hypothetical protein